MPSPVVDNVISTVTAATTVEASATLLINGIQGRIDAAIAAALANGASEAELAPVQAVSDALATQSAELAAAVQANTPLTARK